MAKLKNQLDKVFAERNHSLNESFESFKCKHEHERHEHEKREDRD